MNLKPVRNVAMTAATLALLPLAWLGLASSPAPAVNNNATAFHVISHRGYAANATENTMEAFRAAVSKGAHGIETDIALTRDGQMVLMHDTTLNRTTSCTGRVDQRDLAALRATCFGKRKRERLPVPATLLQWAKPRNVLVIFEIKPTAKMDVADFQRLAEVIDKYSMMGRTIVHSTSLARLKAAEEADSRLHTQLITFGWGDVAPAKPYVDGFNLYAKDISKARVRSLHGAGFYVLGRNTTSSKDWRKIHASGANGVITDQATKAARVLPRRR